MAFFDESGLFSRTVDRTDSARRRALVQSAPEGNLKKNGKSYVSRPTESGYVFRKNKKLKGALPDEEDSNCNFPQFSLP